MPHAELVRSTTADEWQRKYYERQLANITATAALVNAALQLKDLQVLKVTNASDIWKLYPPYTCAAKATAQQAALIADVLAAGELCTLSAAAEALATLNKCGCWLLQHHPVLMELHISTQKQDGACPGSGSSSRGGVQTMM